MLGKCVYADSVGATVLLAPPKSPIHKIGDYVNRLIVTLQEVEGSRKF